MGCDLPPRLWVKRALPYFANNGIQKFSNCAAIVAKSLSKGNITPVAEAMRCIDVLLREANVTTTHLVKIIEQVKSYGVLAGKVYGCRRWWLCIGIVTARAGQASVAQDSFSLWSSQCL